MTEIKANSPDAAIPGVYGVNTAIGDEVFCDGGNGGRCVVGVSANNTAVDGNTTSGIAVYGGSSGRKRGVVGVSAQSTAVEGNTTDGIATYGASSGSGHAGLFTGDVHVTGSLTVDGDIVLSNADYAEDFNIDSHYAVEAGTVMVFGAAGALVPCQQAYDKRAAGVISGAGNFKPGIVLDKQQAVAGRQPIALLGKVYCKVDAQYGPIEAGDLLTTSPTPGHAMKVEAPVKAFGTVIGKALQPFDNGVGLVLILVALQ